jgi:hypothetical protein
MRRVKTGVFMETLMGQRVCLDGVNWTKITEQLLAMTFGIALPKWIVSEKYGSWVLGLYVLIFMVILPLFVVSFWLLFYIDTLI